MNYTQKVPSSPRTTHTCTHIRKHPNENILTAATRSQERKKQFRERKKDILWSINNICLQRTSTQTHPYHGAASSADPQGDQHVDMAPLQELLTSTVRMEAHWILFINKVIYKWWDLSSVCSLFWSLGEELKDGGERWTLSLYPLTFRWVADGC